MLKQRLWLLELGKQKLELFALGDLQLDLGRPRTLCVTASLIRDAVRVA
jgi:hypothetical protein